MAQDEGKQEEKFDFTSEGKALSYISLDQARVLAMRTARESPGYYGSKFANIIMAFDVVEDTETEDHYVVTLSFRPQGQFSGSPGQEQFFIEKEGNIAIRQVLRFPGGGIPLIPVAIAIAVVGVIAAVGAIFALGGSSGGEETEFIAAIPSPTAVTVLAPKPIPTPQPTQTPTIIEVVVTPTPIPFVPRATTARPVATTAPLATPVQHPSFSARQTNTTVPFIRPTPPATPVPQPTPTTVPTNTAFPTRTTLPTATTAPLPTATSAPTATPAPVNATLTYSTDPGAFGVYSWTARRVSLTEAQPPTVLQGPEYPGGATPLYGQIVFGSEGELATIPLAIIELSETDGYVAFFDVNRNGMLSDDPAVPARNGPNRGSVEVFLDYFDGQRPYTIDFNHFHDTDELTFFHSGLYEGEIILGGKVRRFAILDDNSNGLFNDLETDTLILDLDGDGKADGSRYSSDILNPMNLGFSIDGTPFKVSWIHPAGEAIRFDPAQLGELTGRVTDGVTGAPISGATISYAKMDLTVVSDIDGFYSAQVGEGTVSQLTVKADGYIPETPSNFELSQLHVTPETPTTRNFQLTTVGPMAGEVTLQHGESYHFLAREKSRGAGGEFYVILSESGESNFRASRFGQRGLLSLNVIEGFPLHLFDPPDEGYNRLNSQVQLGHTYISLAKEGEEGHFIVFRVTELIPGSSVTLEYLYTPAVMPPPRLTNTGTEEFGPG